MKNYINQIFRLVDSFELAQFLGWSWLCVQGLRPFTITEFGPILLVMYQDQMDVFYWCGAFDEFIMWVRVFDIDEVIKEEGCWLSGG
jgi:hypothetical protein